MKYRQNITASSNKHAPEHTRMRARREVIRRSRIENGVIRVQFIKILPPAAPVGAALPEPDNNFHLTPAYLMDTPDSYNGAAICAKCKRTFFQADGEDCLCHVCWAASLDMPSPPWPGGAA